MSICVSRHGEYSEHGEYDPDNDYICTRCFTFDEDAALTELHRLRREAQPTPVCDHEALLRTIIRTSDQTGTSAATLIQAAEAMLPAPAGVIDREAIARAMDPAAWQDGPSTHALAVVQRLAARKITLDYADRVLTILPTRTVDQVKAEALREAAETLATKDFLLPRGHAPMGVLVDWLRLRADELEREDKR